MIVSLIAAVSQNGIIGKNNDLPWHLPDDMKYFMQTTKSHHVIMGRKNFESIPEKFRPLPNRTNIIVTRQKDYKAEGAIIVHSMEEALEIGRKSNEEEVFDIGGAEIFSLGMKYADRVYLTEIQAAIDGDTYFPEFNKADWKELSRRHHDKDERHQYIFDFVVYERK